MPAKKIFEGVYSIDGRLATVNLTRGRKAYTEELVTLDDKEYRLWNPYRSKLAASILIGLKHFAFANGSSVLYLGAATGTTSSHVSDIVGTKGRVYAVEISERCMRTLIEVCETRANMIPILADARDVERYADAVDACDIVYQDVSVRDQAEILLKNSRFLKRNGYAYFVIKSQSIDISRAPKEIYKEELDKLKGTFSVLETMSLEPYDSMHLFAVLKKL
jgi:fibrillarin-like pre-rRNA processing protein